MDKVAKRRHACGLPVVPIHSLKQRPRQNHPADEKEKINLAFCFITQRIMFSRGYERLIQDNESAAEIIVNFRIHDLNELKMTARSHCRAVFSCDEGWHFQKPPASAGMNGPQRFRPARKGYAQRRTRCA